LEDLKLRVIGHMDRTKQLLSSAYKFECLMEQGGNPTSLAALLKEQGKKIPSRPKPLSQWKRLSRLIINQERQHIVGTVSAEAIRSSALARSLAPQVAQSMGSAPGGEGHRAVALNEDGHARSSVMRRMTRGGTRTQQGSAPQHHMHAFSTTGQRSPERPCNRSGSRAHLAARIDAIAAAQAAQPMPPPSDDLMVGEATVAECTDAWCPGDAPAPLPRLVLFSPESHPQLDLAPGEASLRGWCAGRVSCWADALLSPGGQIQGFSCCCSGGHIMLGLTAAATSSADTFTALDYAFGLHPDGDLVVFEGGQVRYNARCLESASRLAHDTFVEFEISIVSGAVQYKADGKVRYTSSKPPSEALHVAIAWLDTGTVTNARYV